MATTPGWGWPGRVWSDRHGGEETLSCSQAEILGHMEGKRRRKRMGSKKAAEQQVLRAGVRRKAAIKAGGGGGLGRSRIKMGEGFKSEP